MHDELETSGRQFAADEGVLITQCSHIQEVVFKVVDKSKSSAIVAKHSMVPASVKAQLRSGLRSCKWRRTPHTQLEDAKIEVTGHRQAAPVRILVYVQGMYGRWCDCRLNDRVLCKCSPLLCPPLSS